jgi:hypothetical protein
VLLFVSGATATMRKHRDAGELIVPGAGSAPDSLRLIPGRWAMDNGAFVAFDAPAFVAMLERFYRRPGCRFVAAPDAVGDCHQTLTQWPFWSRLIRGVGFPPALVAQDGLTVADVPWREIATLFIGGHTEWKTGPAAAQLIAYARARGLWVHMGRVNSRERLWEAARLGVDSVDGSGFSKWPDINLPKGLQWADETTRQPRLLQ